MEYSLYLHMPFCRHRCHYCDFNTTTGKEHLIADYVGALTKEIRFATVEYSQLPVHSIYFGGGTPSIIPLKEFEIILNTIHTQFLITDDCEVSLEANPGTIHYEYLQGLKRIGFNRISIGVQSTDNFDLVRLDRIHTNGDVLKSYNAARRAGFNNINLDLIFGLPWQTFSGWENSLTRAISLAPEHFSLYSLIIEPNTELEAWNRKGLIAQQDQDLEGDMFELAMALLAQSGFEHYEISNWAKNVIGSDLRCRHNLQYWQNRPYFGFGVSAHGYVEGIRTVNTPVLENYIQKISQAELNDHQSPITPATISFTKIDEAEQMRDFMMLGLRLVDEGVQQLRFKEYFDRSYVEVFEEEIKLLLNQGLIEWVDRSHMAMKLTRRGVLVANYVFMQFV